MRKDKNPALEEHFEKLKQVLPELYHPINRLPRNISEKLYSLLKSSLTIIEALYLQHPESFSAVKVETYAQIISELKSMGITYRGNEELLSKAASQIIMKSKMPMKRAGRRSQGDNSEKKVG